MYAGFCSPPRWGMIIYLGSLLLDDLNPVKVQSTYGALRGGVVGAPKPEQ